ncbi:TPA: ATP-binding protein [Pseudomonas aeruginosa]|nr:ATP-binding protein [Pseudomonas aeruginosa]
MGVAETVGAVPGERNSSVEVGGSEQRRFNVHPGIIRHLIKEQAGTLVKAVAELVMNSVDAGATRIDLEFRLDGTFTVKDNGRGFRDRSEIENFFETFGTPHEEGDATYGRFRIGRGQIMGYASTTWRSGKFQMDVNLLDDGAEFGYTLTEMDEAQPGCQIDGVIKDEEILEEARYTGLIQYDDSFIFHNDIFNVVKYVALPVFFNGKQINNDPRMCEWDFEDEFGYYSFHKIFGLSIYNQGVFVSSVARKMFSIGGVFVSKQPIKLNMARNAVLSHECKVMKHLARIGRKEYLASIDRAERMTDEEIGAVINRIATCWEGIEQHEKDILSNVRFLPAMGGQKVSPIEFLHASQYSLYDGVSSAAAERAVAEGKISLLLPKTFHLAELTPSRDGALQFLTVLLKVFGGHVEKKKRDFIDFSKIIEAYSGVFEEVQDSELSPRSLAALRAVRRVRYDLKSMANDRTGKMRRLVAGRSDCADAWTNGFDYIAFDVRVLEKTYALPNSGGIERLINLALHEFCHQAESSEDSHEHTLHFYKLYHDATISPRYGEIVRICHRRYMSLLVKAGEKVSGEDRRHARSLAKIVAAAENMHPVVRRLYVYGDLEGLPASS